MLVFISYAKEDASIAEKLYSDLKNAGVPSWIDSEDLLSGQKWKDMIHRVIAESSFFIALISSNSVSKKAFVQKELKQALDILDEYPSDKIFIIPVRLDDVEINEIKLKDLHRVDLFPSYEEGLDKILKAIFHNDSCSTGKVKAESPERDNFLKRSKGNSVNIDESSRVIIGGTGKVNITGDIAGGDIIKNLNFGDYTKRL